MSDQLPPEYLAQLKLRDTRFAVLAEAIAVETEMRDSPVIKAILGAVRADADAAMEALVDVSPADQTAVALHLVKVSTLVYIRRTLNRVLRLGQAAEAQIRAEDHSEGG